MLIDTMSILRYTYSSDGYGGSTRTSAAVFTGIPCTVQPLSGNERAAYRGEKVEEVHNLYWENGTTITANDTVKIGTIQYDVEVVADDAGRDHHFKAVIRNMTPAV